MIGDFELPGDEQARTDKVGGASLPPGQSGTEPVAEGTSGTAGKPGGQGNPESNQAGGA
jgi:hypothetical protein